MKSRIPACLVPLIAVVALPLGAAAQTVGTTIDLIAENADPLSTVNYTYGGSSNGSGPLGLIQFQTTGSSPTTYYTYCIDLSMQVVQYQTNTFTYAAVQNSPVAYGFPTMGATKANDLSLLYGAVFGSSSIAAYDPNNYSVYHDVVSPLQGNPANLSTLHQAFQLAVSNIVFDNDWDVTTGTFSATSTLPSAASQANEWLLDVANAGTGASSMPLIALTSVTAQDQILPGIAIPEPSFYGAILGAAALGFTLVRRRRLPG